MKIISKLYDEKIRATNVLAEISVREYADLIEDVVENNEFQRKRVRSSKSVYSLLKADLLEGCIIPPIVLALTSNQERDQNSTDDQMQTDIESHKADLVILDGLQRTLTILDLLTELEGGQNQALEKFEQAILRLEFYIGINRIGILYRMLTLNTGQTPMSLRQQIEMLYLDYANQEVDGINIVREADVSSSYGIESYIFKDLIEGYLAYLERSPLPIDRGRLLADISNIDKLSKQNIRADKDLFEQFISTLKAFVDKVNSLCNGDSLGEEFSDVHGNPFGKDVPNIFKRSQSIAGLGAALGKLIDNETLMSFDDAKELIEGFAFADSDSPLLFLTEINAALVWLKNNSSKIGNSQREYFVWFFRELFNEDSDSYCNLVRSAESALSRYKSVNF